MSSNPSALAESIVQVVEPAALLATLLWTRSRLATKREAEGKIQLPVALEDTSSPQTPVPPRLLIFALLALPTLAFLVQSITALLSLGHTSTSAGLYLALGTYIWLELSVLGAKDDLAEISRNLRLAGVVGVVSEGALMGLKTWAWVAAHQHSAPTPSLLSLVLVSLRFTSLLVLTLTLTFPHVIARRSPPVAVVPVAAETKEDDKDEDKDQITTWAVFFERLWKLSPYLWPSDSLKLQFFSFLCLVVVVVGRISSVWLPLALGRIIDDLSDHRTPTNAFIVYFTLSILASSFGGILNFLHDMLWLPVSLHSENRLQVLCFDRILELSMSWQNKKNTGETLSILDQGAAVNELFHTMLFEIGPTFIDLVSVLVVFYLKFGLSVAVMIVGLVILNFVTATTTTDWRQRFQRGFVDQRTKNRGIHTDVLMNWETVKYFTAEQHESTRYTKAVKIASGFYFWLYAAWDIIQLGQTFIMISGLLLGSVIVSRSILHHRSSPGDFIVFITYIGQLTGPLDSLRGTYRKLSEMIVNAEKLLTLLNEELDVKDSPSAVPLVVSDGVIEFDNVHFAYDPRRPALKGVSFKVPKGARVALVGESGSGKSTILRLLFRFYNLDSGSIRLDGQDIAAVTQDSLRRAIGVVPQDTALFNDTIRYNLEYGKIGASMVEIEQAAKAARIHDRILTFPDGYDTLAGERGVKLSGGEKQRLSIARAMLKSPPILLLDEATSALDTNTEREIQAALNALLKGRTSLTIAHRLSTIVQHDLIIIMAEGQIVEQGTHKELLEKNGLFAQMWQKQIESEAEKKEGEDVLEEKLID